MTGTLVSMIASIVIFLGIAIYKSGKSVFDE